MKIKHIISCALALTLFCGLSSAVAEGTVGGQQDPLISKSYIDSTYSNAVLKDPLDTLNNSIVVLKLKLNKALQAPSTQGKSLMALPKSGITISSGGSFTLVSGKMTLTACSGTMLDLTDGKTVPIGQELLRGHRYLAAENTTATAMAATAATVTAFGSVSSVGEVVVKFSDVPEGIWYYDDVYYAVSKNLVNGKSATSYAPDENITIAEAIKLAACMHQLHNNGSVTLEKDPVVWYKSYVDYAAANGIVTKTYSNYDAKITRREFISVFYAALPETEYTAKNSVADNSIPDVKLTDSGAKQIYTFYRAGILVGSDAKGNFLPETNIKRSEVAATLTRMFETSARKPITLS
ncbi:MAG: S-layer homology domain-containing protein [Oscillospiraceae bacterium]